MIRLLPSRKAEHRIALGDYIAVVQTFRNAPRLVAVPVDGAEHAAAVAGTGGWSLPAPADYSEDAATFAAVAFDNGDLDGLLGFLCEHTDLAAPADRKAFMLACVDALAARLRDDVAVLAPQIVGGEE